MIYRAKKRDEVTAKTLSSFEKTGNTANRWNNPAAREKQSATRRDTAQWKVTAINEGRNRIDSLNKQVEELMAKIKASRDHQKAIDDRKDKIKAVRENDSKVSMMGQTLDEEKKTLNEERKAGIAQRKVWSGKVVEIQQVISDEMKALGKARTRDSRPPTPPCKGKATTSQLHPASPNAPQTPTSRDVRRFSETSHPFCDPFQVQGWS